MRVHTSLLGEGVLPSRFIKLGFGICKCLSLHNMNFVSKGKVERGVAFSLLVSVE